MKGDRSGIKRVLRNWTENSIVLRSYQQLHHHVDLRFQVFDQGSAMLAQWNQYCKFNDAR
ncbi:hypothetical protein HanLR1_Chr10g0376341 [Helianthus annuus]|nr:hypothetical protein HanHA89_Chr10g0399121 [Helianthus annuus]KAJ0698095.1 hypothetical protein HanLR1_Chr10g0376341 [Helianthus annuus]